LKDLRLARSKKLLNILKKTHPIIPFFDEKYFTVDKVINPKSDRYITNKPVKDVPGKIRTT